MFGTDYPMEDMIRSVEFVDKLPISIVDAEKVYYKMLRNILAYSSF